jgi:hypothetical protein
MSVTVQQIIKTSIENNETVKDILHTIENSTVEDIHNNIESLESFIKTKAFNSFVCDSVGEYNAYGNISLALVAYLYTMRKNLKLSLSDEIFVIRKYNGNYSLYFIYDKYDGDYFEDENAEYFANVSEKYTIEDVLNNKFEYKGNCYKYYVEYINNEIADMNSQIAELQDKLATTTASRDRLEAQLDCCE